MGKKKVEGEQPKVAAEVGTQTEDRKEQAQEKKSAGIVTTEGNTIDKIRIFQKDGATMVQADYGKLKEGKTSEERRANMRTQISRELTPEQSKEYQRLAAEDPAKAKDYAVRVGYPMHVDDAAFHLKDTEVNGRKVNYIILEKLSADKLNEKNKHLAGSWQLSFGVKDHPETRFFGILNKEDLASIRHRAEVTLDDKGKVKTVGAPLTLADIAGRVESRVMAQRQANEAKVESAQKVDWNKLLSTYKLPEGATLTALRFAPSKDNPDRVWLNGKANGIEVFALLSKNETTAVKNKLLTLEQAAAVNKEFRTKVNSIVAPAKAVSMGDAVNAVIDRASDPAAKAFTPEQVKVLNDFAADAKTPEERQKIFDGVWAGAQAKLAGVNEAWLKDAHQELNDLAEGAVREEQQSMKR